jgi:predicted AAA+ superfamily ATPase
VDNAREEMVKVIYKPRQSGKTTELIEMASIGGGYVVCHNRAEACSLERAARELGKSILFPITFDEYLSGAFAARNIKEFYIDNVELLLSRLSMTVPVKAIAVNKEDA